MSFLKYSMAILVMALSLSSSAKSFEITDCSDSDADAKLLSTSISNCPNKSGKKCALYKGENSTLIADFTTTKSFTQANISMVARIFGIDKSVPFDGPHDACGNYGFSCPTEVNKPYTLNFTLPIPSSAPSISAELTLHMQDKNKNDIICFQVPVKITSR